MTPEESLKFFSEWKTAYMLAFSDSLGKPAFADLAQFCRAHQTCVVPGDRDQSYVMEGRRQVFLRIQNFLERTPEELVALYTKPLEAGATDD